MSKKGRLQQEKEEDPQEMHHGSVGQDSPTEHQGEEVEMMKTEEEEVEVEVEETRHLLLGETQKSETMGQS